MFGARVRIDIPPYEAWNAASEQIRCALPFQNAAVSVQAFAGFQHALYEVTLGLARFYSHKKTIALVEPAEIAIEQIAIAFSEDGYTVKRLSENDLNELNKLKSTLEPFLNDLVFVMWGEDDPVTGRLNDFNLLDSALADKRVFRLKLSHSSYRQSPVIAPASFEVRICSLRSDFAFALGGDRYRVVPQLAPRLFWKPNLVCKDDFQFMSSDEVNQQKQTVLSFENSLSQNFRPYFRPYFGTDEKRVYDRAVLVAVGVDGSAVIDFLAESLNLEIPSPGLAAPFESTSPCRWNHPRLTEWLLARGETEESIRGLVVIDAVQISTKTATLLNEAVTKILKIQSGN